MRFRSCLTVCYANIHPGCMGYDFSTLSPVEFENLVRDLLGGELGIRFEAFSEGPDSGMDGRHTIANDSTILQAKHYRRSSFSSLKATMTKERQAIDRLQPTRYILATSTPLTPKNKAALGDVIGPWLSSPGDIFGPDDLNGLLRKFPAIDKAHLKLWGPSGTPMFQAAITEAVEKALKKPGDLPPALAALFPAQTSGGAPAAASPAPLSRDVVFLIKASPVDDEFVLWLAPKLEAEGYRVFADILTLQPGDRWRREINLALQHRAAKVLLICRDSTLADTHVQDDLDIALEVGKDLNDKRFIIPLRLEAGKKVKGIGDAVAVDFVRSWGDGLASLLDALRRQSVPRSSELAEINPNWEVFRRRGAIPLTNEPERLTSNWLRVVEAPDVIRYFNSRGVIERHALQSAVESFTYPAVIRGGGFFTFADPADVADHFQTVGRFTAANEVPLPQFVEKGIPRLGIEPQVASNFVTTMLKSAWNTFCRRNGFEEYAYATAIGFHASPEQAPTGCRIPWGRQGTRRSSMLRNSAKGHIWQFGVTATPSFWPFWHFKLKSRVLFAVDNGSAAGLEIDDAKKLHRLRRTVCKGWRNKVWLGRMLAFLEILSGESAYIRLALSGSQAVVLEASPILFTSPVSTALPNVLDADADETDPSTLGRPESEEGDEK